MEDEEYDKQREHGCDMTRSCKRSDADRYAGMNVHLGYNGYLDEDQCFVFHPVWHSHSWVTTDELGAAVRKYSAIARKKNWENCSAPSDIKAILAAMRSLKKDGHEPRFVFWFDN